MDLGSSGCTLRWQICRLHLAAARLSGAGERVFRWTEDTIGRHAIQMRISYASCNRLSYRSNGMPIYSLPVGEDRQVRRVATRTRRL